MANIGEPRCVGSGRPAGSAGSRIAAADSERFAEWCRRHGPAVHAFLARRAGRQLADDLFGDVWLRAFTARATYDDRIGEPLPWLYGIARNVLRAHWRTGSSAQVSPATTSADPWSEADERVDAGRRLAHLRRALARLSEAEREVLLLVAWERLTPTEVARMLDIPPGTARSRLHRARQLMRDEMEDPVAVHVTSVPVPREEQH